MGSILEMREITKRFTGVVALKDVNLVVQAGEIHAICGENGAGKSTLMKVLSGVHPHGTYEGQIFYDGEEVKFDSIRDSEEKGIIIIHQELALVPLMTIAENIFLGNEQANRGVIDSGVTHSRAAELLKKVGLKEVPDELITNLGVGKQQLVDLLAALFVVQGELGVSFRVVEGEGHIPRLAGWRGGLRTAVALSGLSSSSVLRTLKLVRGESAAA